MGGWVGISLCQAADSLLIYDAALRDFAATSERRGWFVAVFGGLWCFVGLVFGVS